MADATLLWILGSLTALTGGALVWMLIKRRREAIVQAIEHEERLAQLARIAQRARKAEERERQAQQDAERNVLVPAHWRASTDPEEAAEAQLDGEGPAQICPHCGKRYGYGVRVCARDNKKLSALN